METQFCGDWMFLPESTFLKIPRVADSMDQGRKQVAGRKHLCYTRTQRQRKLKKPQPQLSDQLSTASLSILRQRALSLSTCCSRDTKCIHGECMTGGSEIPSLRNTVDGWRWGVGCPDPGQRGRTPARVLVVHKAPSNGPRVPPPPENRMDRPAHGGFPCAFFPQRVVVLRIVTSREGCTGAYFGHPDL